MIWKETGADNPSAASNIHHARIATELRKFKMKCYWISGRKFTFRFPMMHNFISQIGIRLLRCCDNAMLPIARQSFGPLEGREERFVPSAMSSTKFRISTCEQIYEKDKNSDISRRPTCPYTCRWQLNSCRFVCAALSDEAIISGRKFMKTISGNDSGTLIPASNSQWAMFQFILNGNCVSWNNKTFVYIYSRLWHQPACINPMCAALKHNLYVFNITLSSK